MRSVNADHESRVSGVAFHSTMLANLGVEEPEIDLIREGEAPSAASTGSWHRELGAEPVEQVTLPTSAGMVPAMALLPLDLRSDTW